MAFDDRGAFLHLLSPVAGEVLGLVLKPGGLRVRDLALELLEGDPSEAEMQQVQGLLDHLSGLGLIEPLTT